MGYMGFFFSSLFVEEKLFHRKHGETILPFSGGKISASFAHLYFCVNGVVRKRDCAWGMQSLTCLTDKTHHVWQHGFNDFTVFPVGEESTEMREREMHTVLVEAVFPAPGFFLGTETSRPSVSMAGLLHRQELFQLLALLSLGAAVSVLSCTVIDFQIRCFCFPVVSGSPFGTDMTGLRLAEKFVTSSHFENVSPVK